MKNSEILRQARALAMNPETSCTGSLAKDRDGVRLSDPLDPTACRWCAIGAVAKVTGYSQSHHNAGIGVEHPAFDLLQRAAGEVSSLAAWVVHDTRNNPLRNEMWDRAIQLAEEEEAQHA